MFENEGQATEQPVESPELDTETTPQSQSMETAPPSIPDLDSMEKFKYGGREMTPKELQSMVLMQSDYTKKTQALSEERKYYDNLSADLAAVKSNPALVDKFKSIYPEKFHSYLGYVAQQQPAQTQSPQNSQYAQIDPQVMQRFQRIEADMNERSVAAINAELDAKFSKLSEKFPYADEEAAIARAQALMDRGEKITDKMWEGIFKSVHEKNETTFKQRQAEITKKQKEANSRGKEASGGGGIPGQAPRSPKTIKEASKYALEEMANL
jgi:hypothetical protein